MNFFTTSAGRVPLHVSQQIQALVRELGFYLLERKNCRFMLTLAGEYFYKKSLVLVVDYEGMCREAGKLAKDDKATSAGITEPTEISRRKTTWISLSSS